MCSCRESDQPAQQHNLIRAFAFGMRKFGSFATSSGPGEDFNKIVVS